MDDSIFDRRLEDQLCFRLYRAANGLGKIYTRALRPFQLTFSQYLVLLALWDKDQVLVTDIGARTGMGMGTLNPVLKRMAKHGWIAKKTHESDKRVVLILLTEKAHEIKPAINQSILKELKEVQFEGLNLLDLMKQLNMLQVQLDVVNEPKN